jgi:non-specific serine/threonine protein kinase
LPRELTSFVGRQQQLADVQTALRSTGLLTLVGPGGVGKTRLALRAAAQVQSSYAFGVWLVELASLSDPARVAPTIAATLGIRERPGWDTIDTLRAVLRHQQTLLLLDNCEHVLNSCSEVAKSLLTACSNLTILATSREPLTIPGETVFPVPPLQLADSEEPFERLVECDAMQLLATRIRGSLPDFEVTPANALEAARICGLVDGLPLGIELAAARANIMTLPDIAERLRDPLKLLTVGPRTAPGRQKTLRATIDWSYALLTERERSFLRRLSVFAGGCTIESATTVCGVAEFEVIELLDRLVSHSLVTADTRYAHTRFFLLETVRQYCMERLDEAAETDPVRERHRDWCLALIAGTAPEAFDTERASDLLLELENLRAAFRWACDSGQVEAAAQLALGMTTAWHLSGNFSEGRATLTTVLDLALDGPAAAQVAHAGTWAGTMAANQGDYLGAEEIVRRALHVAQRSGDAYAILFAENQLGWIAFVRGDMERARAAYEQTFAVASQQTNDPIHLVSRYQLAMACIEQRDRARALELLEPFATIVRDAQSGIWRGRLQLARALLAEQVGDYATADRLLAESVAAERAVDDQPGLLRSLTLRGAVAVEHGDRAAAVEALTEALHLGELHASKLRVAQLFEAVAALMVPGSCESAVRLVAAAEQLRTTLAAVPVPSERARAARVLEVAKRRVGEAAYAGLWQAAQTESLAVMLAETRRLLAEVADPARRVARDLEGDRLSEREREVAVLVARGFSNREIAETLVITRKTAEAHVHHVLNKLGLTNRVQIATWGLRQGMVQSPRPPGEG